MEFGEKLKQLRKKKGLTQDELAEALYVSRTAISKWESGRGFPNIESLRELSGFFAVTVDELLSGDELMTLAEEEQLQKEMQFKDLLFGLLDCGMGLLLFLPFFGQKFDEGIEGVSLLGLQAIPLYSRLAYFVVVLATAVFGILLLALQGCQHRGWVRYKRSASLLLSAVGVSLFIVGQQPYAAIFTFLFLMIKTLMTRSVSRM